nr:hypothetical protein [uncultured Mediterranean phage uvMED]
MILLGLLTSFTLALLGVILMIHLSFWIGFLLCVVSIIQVFRYIELSKQSNGYYSQRK